MRKMNVLWTGSYINCREEVVAKYENCYAYVVKIVRNNGETSFQCAMKPNEKAAIDSVVRMLDDVASATIVEDFDDGDKAEICVFGKWLPGVVKVSKFYLDLFTVETSQGAFHGDSSTVRPSFGSASA